MKKRASNNQLKSRKIISHKHDLKRGVDFIGVNVVFFCHDGKGNLLLHKRSNKCRDECGHWDCGAGAMEFGETFEEAVCREVKEEYGVDVKEMKMVRVHNVIRDNKGVKTHWVPIVFAVRVNPRQVINGDPEKIDELGWFTIDSLPEPLHSILHENLKFVKKLGILKNEK